MTVLIYLDTSKQVGDPDHLKVFASADAAEAWFAENDPEAARSNIQRLPTNPQRSRRAGGTNKPTVS
jgi:hypothetical protein